ncbi:MAG: indolepyruvate oxidoreductase subunit beta [Deltaproteobacteria bacterium]|jgi:indolepyruvate ferredoxin oxidoreductase beta subunit|nr:indolepyruvate oxidoreductase subunit beta [Deltaproteobacteria bacterium]
MDDLIQNILICGIGGQGVVLAGKIISLAAFESGKDIKTSEVHGMSQRGGSVSTHIRYGKKIFSPLIPGNEATAILSFDIYETARYIRSFANEKTIIISSNHGKIPQWTPKNKNDKIGNGAETVNENGSGAIDEDGVAGLLRANFKSLHLIDDKRIAADLGNIKVSNIILIGILSGFSDIKKEIWLKAIEKNIPRKTADLNINAFLTGRNYYENQNHENKIF